MWWQNGELGGPGKGKGKYTRRLIFSRKKVLSVWHGFARSLSNDLFPTSVPRTHTIYLPFIPSTNDVLKSSRSYPVYQEDPFVLESTLSVFFSYRALPWLLRERCRQASKPLYLVIHTVVLNETRSYLKYGIGVESQIPPAQPEA
jgi:hypothetical protein